MSFSSRLLAWYKQHGRDLPWRKTRDPYRILVSEIMLHQTQVNRVLIFYPRWLKQFPSWKSLACASNADVIRTWSGLGYNRRALMLRDIAKQVTTKGVPINETGWSSLKGIGPYTAAAISAFALHKRALPIDTNIRRVLGRLLLGQPFPEIKDDKRIAKKIDTILPVRGKFYDVPQALFDLATSICTKNPDCQHCPLRNDCLAAPKFLKNNLKAPKRTVKKANERIHRNKKYPDRIYRGRILKIIGNHPQGIVIHLISKQIDPTFERLKDGPWLLKMIQRIKKDGLVEQRRNKLFLPE